MSVNILPLLLISFPHSLSFSSHLNARGDRLCLSLFTQLLTAEKVNLPNVDRPHFNCWGYTCLPQPLFQFLKALCPS